MARTRGFKLTDRSIPAAPQNMAATVEGTPEDRQQSHIRTIGPHKHEWRPDRSDGPTVYQQCARCGTRRAAGGNPSAAGRQWIEGGRWGWEDKA